MKAVFSFFIGHLRGYRHRYTVLRSFQRAARGYASHRVILLCDRQVGFFSIFLQVLGAYKIARINNQVLLLRFTSSPYFDPHRDEPTWWDYYFKETATIRTCRETDSGEGRNALTIGSLDQQHELSALGATLFRDEAAHIVGSIPLTDEVEKRVQTFCQKMFEGDYVIGLHYRGTDKVEGSAKEALRVEYSLIAMLLEKLRHLPFNFSLFVASDEAAFISYIQTIYSGKVYFTQSERSSGSDPVHLGKHSCSGYDLGIEALVDSILLSKCDFLFRCESNLSFFSTFFNPDLECLNLTPLIQDLDASRIDVILTNTLETIIEIHQSKCSTGFLGRA